MVRALQRSILGRNCGASLRSISVQRTPRLAEIDGERQPDRPGADDENLGVDSARLHGAVIIISA